MTSDADQRSNNSTNGWRRRLQTSECGVTTKLIDCKELHLHEYYGCNYLKMLAAIALMVGVFAFAIRHKYSSRFKSISKDQQCLPGNKGNLSKTYSVTLHNTGAAMCPLIPALCFSIFQLHSCMIRACWCSVPVSCPSSHRLGYEDGGRFVVGGREKMWWNNLCWAWETKVNRAWAACIQWYSVPVSMLA